MMQQPEPRITAHSRIHDFFVERIQQGTIDIGDKLPTEAEIARQFGVCRATVQNAMSRLALEGWIERFPGRGTFAKEQREIRNINIDVHNIRSFDDDLAITGDCVAYRLLSFGRVRASPLVASRIGVKIGGPIFHLERLRLVNGSCIGYERRYFSPKLRVSIDTAALDQAPTHRLIEEHLGQRIGRIDATLRGIVADKRDAELLGIELGAPLLLRSHTIYSTDGDLILYGDSAYLQVYAFHYTANISESDRSGALL